MIPDLVIRKIYNYLWQHKIDDLNDEYHEKFIVDTCGMMYTKIYGRHNLDHYKFYNHRPLESCHDFITILQDNRYYYIPAITNKKGIVVEKISKNY